MRDDESETKGPPWFGAELDGESIDGHDLIDVDEDHTLRFCNPDAENGTDECRGPLSWLNSARVTLDPEEDAVHFNASIFDPRGGFGFTVRRIQGIKDPELRAKLEDNAGIIVIHTPYPGAGMQHASVREVAPGTVEVIHDHNLPRIPDEAELLRQAVARLREALPTRRRLSKGPGADRFWSTIDEWEKARAAHAAAVPIRVAVHDDEKPSTEEE